MVGEVGNISVGASEGYVYMYDSSLNFPPDGAKIMKVHTYMKSGFLHLEGIIEYCIVRMCT